MARWIVSLVVFMSLALPAIGPGDAAVQVSTAYSGLNLERCAEMSRPGSEQPDVVYRCRGFNNIAKFDVYVFERDGRYFVSYGRDAFDRRAATQTLAPFNTIGDDLEWLLERRSGDWEPFATIVRYFTEIEDNGSFFRGEVLVISKIGPGEACHVAYIDARATPNANRLARETAGQIVRRFDCATQDPIIIGERGRSLGPTS